MVGWFAFSAFVAITVGQELLALVLTPTLVAGAIAEEKRRKTMHYLLASQLTSAEIVLGKLAARLLPVLGLTAVAAVYGASYLWGYRHTKSLGGAWFFFNAFSAGMTMSTFKPDTGWMRLNCPRFLTALRTASSAR